MDRTAGCLIVQQPDMRMEELGKGEEVQGTDRDDIDANQRPHAAHAFDADRQGER